MNRMHLFHAVMFSLAIINTAHAMNGSAEEKQQAILNSMQNTRYEGLPRFTSPGLFGLYHLSCPEFVAQAFTHQGDEMIEGRTKYIHSHGTVAPVRLVAENDNGYAGILGQGAQFGLLRISVANKPSRDNIIPGLALKFFLDERWSVNLMAMPSLDPQTSFNIFENNYLTVLEEPTPGCINSLIQNSFQEGLEIAGFPDAETKAFKLDDFVRWTQNGEAEELWAAPDFLSFEPGEYLKEMFEAADHRSDFRQMLDGKGKDSVLFYIYDHNHSRIARIEGNDDFFASAFGDEGLFFHHPDPRNY